MSDCLTTGAVLFDLDGTLADTAPDLAAAANHLRITQGLEPMPFADLRPFTSQGARGLVGKALGLRPGDDGFEAAKDVLLAFYQANICVQTRLFDSFQALLDGLAAQARPWGIVTNKAHRFTDPLIAAMALQPAPGVVVCGDTTPHAKPHPAPLLHAAAQLGVDPRHCIYVGDDLRDIQAGRAAGMLTVAAGYGYCGVEDPPHAWNADHLVANPEELFTLLGMSTATR